MEVIEKNIAAIEKKYGHLAEKIREFDVDEWSGRMGLDTAANGELIPWVGHEGRRWRLNSRLNPKRAAEIYADRYQIRLYGIYFIFGFSDGMCVRKLLEKCDDTNLLVVCEPDLELFVMICHQYDICDLIEEKRVLFYFAELEGQAELVFRQIIDYSRIKLLEFCILPGYDVLYPKECQEYMDGVLDRMRYEIMNRNTHIAFERLAPQNILFHMKNLIFHKNIEQLRRALADCKVEEIPAIIVAAGPSLDKNISELKKAQGKAFIIVVDAALRTVLKAGVRPDLVCSVDAKVPDCFFEGVDLDGIIWAYTGTSRRYIAEKFGTEIFYYGHFYRGWSEVLSKELGYTIPAFDSGGSVSSEGFVLALYLGFRKIILIGQDLAFTGGQSHTKEVVGTFGSNEEYISSRKVVEVEGIDGMMLETDFQMWFYKQWFEKVIRMNAGQIEVIDATEGGAKIEGTENCTLEEAIKRECQRELNIYEIEKSIPNAFSAEKQQQLLVKLKEIKQEVTEFRRQTAGMIDKQERLLMMAKDKSVPEKDLLKRLKNLMSQNEEIEDKPILSFVILYARKTEYEVGDNIYTEENMSAADLIEKSLLLYRGYQKGAELLEEDIDEIIIKD